MYRIDFVGDVRFSRYIFYYHDETKICVDQLCVQFPTECTYNMHGAHAHANII